MKIGRIICFIVPLLSSGCYMRADRDTQIGTSQNDALISPVSFARIKDQPKSHWEICLNEYKGYAGAQDICNERMELSRPDALPLCGTPGAMMNGGWYGGYGYRQGTCRQPKR